MSNTEGMHSLADASNVRVGGFSAKRFKPEAGKTYRIHFVTEEVMMRARHYKKVKPNAGYYRCTMYTGRCPVCEYVNEDFKNRKAMKKSDAYGVNLIVYDTDERGQLKQPYNAEVMFWAFGSDKYLDLNSIRNEWGPLDQLDLVANCTDPQFQKFTFTPAKKCYYLEIPELKALIDSKIKTDSAPLDKYLCRDVTPVALAQAFGIPWEGASNEGPASFNGPASNTAPTQNPVPQSPTSEPIDIEQSSEVSASQLDKFNDIFNI